MKRHFAMLGASVALTLAACSAAPVESKAQDSAAIDYRSTTGQEYALGATLRFQLSAEDQSAPLEDRPALLEKAARKHIDTVTTAVNAELARLWPEADRLKKPGVAVMLRQSAPLLASLREADDGGIYSFDYHLEFGAQSDFDQRLPTKAVEGSDGKFFIVNADLGNGAEPVALGLTRVDRSRNAYPLYEDMFSDGLDIAIQMGGDYNDSRGDLRHAKYLFAELVRLGFQAPVKTFDDLTLDSAPFKRTMKVKGKDVEVRARIVHAEMTTPETRDKLIDAYKGFVKNADIIIYSGHAGTQLDYSGVAVAYKPSRVALPASEFKNLDAPDKYQIFVFDGCETYTGYADKLYENPKKNAKNADVVTVVNFSATQEEPNQEYAFLRSFLAEKDGEWVPRSWDSVLEKVNGAADASWVHVYGVHGIDDNPKLSPLADVSKFGAKCNADSDCGAKDSYCLTVAEGTKRCGMACADADGCPDGGRCSFLKDYPSSDDKQCIPSP